jgi:dihydropyrimidinase
MKTYIINGTVIFEQKVEISDIEIKDGKINKIGQNLKREDNSVVIDATGKHVFPGIVDFHAHFNETIGHYSTNETVSSATYSGILNGVTTVNSFILQDANHSMVQSISTSIEQAKNKTYSDIRWHLTPTRFSDVNFTEINRLIDKGFCTFKFYTTYKNANLYLSYDKISEFVKRISLSEPTILIHCEEDTVMNMTKLQSKEQLTPSSMCDIRNEESELNAVERVIDICKITQSDTVVAHCSTSDSIGQIELAKRECPIMCEVTPPNIFLSEVFYNKENGHRYHITPPLRSEECRQLMEKKILLNYAEIFSSNHRSYSLENKDKSKNDIRNVPQGIPSIGALFHLFTKFYLSNPDFPFHNFFRKLSSNPARLAKIYPQKGVIAIGSDADILVVNLNGEERQLYGTLTPNSFNPWEHLKTKFRFDYVLLRGKVVVKDDKIVDVNNFSGEILTTL